MTTGLLFGLLCALSWACGSIMMKAPARKLDPFTLNAPRALAGGLVMALVALSSGHLASLQALTGRQLFFLLSSILVGGLVGDSLYAWSLKRIGVARAYTISSIYPAITLLFGVLAMGEQVDLSVIAGLVLVLAGLWLVGGRSEQSEPGLDAKQKRLGVLAALAAALFWAAGMLLLAPGLDGVDMLAAVPLRLLVLALAYWAVVGARRSATTLRRLSWRERLLMVLGGVVGWGLGTLCFLSAVAALGPTRASIITSTSPLFALPLSVILLREKVNWAVLSGTALTVCGILLVT